MTDPCDERENDPASGSATGDVDESTTDDSALAGDTGRVTAKGEVADEPAVDERDAELATDQRDEPEDIPPHYRRDTTEETDDRDEDSWALVVRDISASLGAVALIGFYLFAISGVWPPMVAIESGSMEPNMDVNDLVFIMDPDRFQPDEAQGDSGVVTAETGDETGYTQFGDSGDVVVFAPNGNTDETPIIHRVMFWVEEGEDWTERANEEYLGTARSCSDLGNTCPAPHDGFITKGDRNQVYDQVQTDQPVKPEWVVGTAEVRLPGLGWFRLQFQ